MKEFEYRYFYNKLGRLLEIIKEHEDRIRYFKEMGDTEKEAIVRQDIYFAAKHIKELGEIAEEHAKEARDFVMSFVKKED